MVEDLENFWENLLSREHDKILLAWAELSAEEKTAVFDHLTQMVTEDGWHEAQVISAQVALDVLVDQNPHSD